MPRPTKDTSNDNQTNADCKRTLHSYKQERLQLIEEIAIKEAELKAFVEEKSREIGLTLFKRRLSTIQKKIVQKCEHKNSYQTDHISLGYGEFDTRYHCRDCDKRWSE